MDLRDFFHTPVEIINKRFFISLAKNDSYFSNAVFFSISNDDWYDYCPFYQDFGPLELRQINRFYTSIMTLLKRDDCVLVLVTGLSNANIINSIFLACTFRMIYLNISPEKAFEPFSSISNIITPYRDASSIDSQYDLTILSCLKGLEKGIHNKWFIPGSFDEDKTYFYEQVENGDMNWLIPGKLLAFASPYDNETTYGKWEISTPKNLIPIFREMHINHIIRLCNKMYDEKVFIKEGFRHTDLFFVDGTVPPPEIRDRFLNLMESNEVIALHCKAGLGRTGTLAGCYLIKKFGFTADEAMGWIRICRPGSIIGPQQGYLIKYHDDIHPQFFIQNPIKNEIPSPSRYLRDNKKEKSNSSPCPQTPPSKNVQSFTSPYFINQTPQKPPQPRKYKRTFQNALMI